MNQRIRFLADRLSGIHIPAAWWLIPLAVPALVPLARSRFWESPDGVLHVYRVVALDHALRSGVLYPRWFSEFSFGYGFPLLNFFGAASYYWAVPFTLLGLDAALAVKLALATGVLASAVGMYLFARQHLGRVAGLIAAVTYVYLPYHLVDLYVRGAVPECMAFVWLPWILLAIRRAALLPGLRGLLHAGLAALLFSALVLTHNVIALAFGPVLSAYGLLLWRQERKHAMLGRLALVVLMAAVFTAFYWLPMLAESRYVGVRLLAGEGYQAHMLPLTRVFTLDLAYRYAGTPGEPSTYPIGLGQLGILVAALAALANDWLRRPRSAARPARPWLGWTMLLFFVTALLSIWLLTTSSRVVWQSLGVVMAYFQFPWRLQVLTVLATAFLAGAAWQLWSLTRRAPRPAALALAYVALVAWALWRLPITPNSPALGVEDMWHWERQVGQVGTTWDAEFLPIWVAEQRWAISQPASATSRTGPTTTTEAATATSRLTMAAVGYGRYDLELDAPDGARVVLHQFHFPGWQARWQDTTLLSRPESSLGLAAFDLAPGRGPLTLRLGLTSAQLWGTWVSVLGLLLAGVAATAFAQTSARRPAAGTLFLAVACLLPAAVLLGHIARPNGNVLPVMPVNAILENRAELLSFSVDRSHYQAGQAFDVTLYWLAMQSGGRDLKAYVHLTDAAVTRQVAQHDTDPGGGYSPSSRWLNGEIVPDEHHLTLPHDLPPGRYAMWAGLYEPETVRNLAVLSPGVRTAGDRVFLGEIEVATP